MRKLVQQANCTKNNRIFKKVVREITGKYLSYPSLEEYLEDVKNNSHYILLLALLLGDPEIRKKKTWNALAKSFFNHYREKILEHCGYDIGPSNLERIRVKESKLFIEYMSGMFRNEMFEECSYEELARLINLVFNTGYEQSYICNLLKAANEDYQQIHDGIRMEIKREAAGRDGFLNN
ncbi:hypothetical protein [uncultured Parabacteroides sp.]|nr:hypothetical protein [uncultured Parabacteroides sp.]